MVFRLRVENLGDAHHVVRPSNLRLENSDGRGANPVHPPGAARQLVPRAGLLLRPGESREGFLYFSLPESVQPRVLRVVEPTADGGTLDIPLP